MNLNDIGSLMDKASSPKIQNDAQNLQTRLNESRIPYLLDAWEKQLSGEELTQFQNADYDKKISIMQEKNYKLNEDVAREFVNTFSVKLLEQTNLGLEGSYAEAIHTAYNDPEANVDEKAAAIERMTNLNFIVQGRFGFDPAQIAAQGARNGFNDQFWNQSTQNIGSGYVQMKSDGFLSQIKSEDLKSYTESIAQTVPGFNFGAVQAQGDGAMKQVGQMYRQAQKQGDYTGFKKQLTQFF